MVSCLTFRSFIHFEFMFVCGVRKWSSFILLHVAVQFSQHHLLKRLFSTWYSFLLCQTLIGHSLCVQFVVLYSIPLVCVSVFAPIPYCLDDYSFVVEAKVQDCDASHFGFLFQHYFGYSGSFVVPYKFEDRSSSEKNAGTDRKSVV